MSGIADFGGSSANTLYSGPRRALAYPSPFFDIGQRYVPRNIKEIFKWTQYHFTSNSIIYPIVNKMAEYPVTGFLYSGVSETAEDTWKKVLEGTLSMRSTMISILEDLMVYGNSFIKISYPFVRYLESPSGERYRASQVNYKIRIRDKKWFFYGKDPKSGQEVQDRKSVV